jgi:hypothetical protein
LIYPRVAATFIDEATMNKEQKRDICVKEALSRPFRPSLFSNNRIHYVARVVVDFLFFLLSLSPNFLFSSRCDTKPPNEEG